MDDDFVKTSIRPNILYKLNKISTSILMSHDKLHQKCILNSKDEERKVKKIMEKIKMKKLSILNMKIHYNTVIIKRIW